MRGILAQRPQVQMEVSVTGLDGLAAVRAKPPHLILLDMHLPDISGLELLRHLKADPRHRGDPGDRRLRRRDRRSRSTRRWTPAPCAT